MTDTEHQSSTDDTRTGPSRRAFLALAAGGAAAVPLLTSCGSGTTTTPAASTPALTKPPAPQRGSRPNIVFVFTDQERYFRSWPSGMSLAARERLAEEGVTFHNHYTSAVMCTSSRAVMLTGLQTPDNGMFEKNADLPYVNAMSTTVPHHRASAAQGRVLHRIPRKMAPGRRVRPRARPARAHRPDGCLRLLRLRTTGRLTGP